MTRATLTVIAISFAFSSFAQTEITDQIVYTCQIQNDNSRWWHENLNPGDRSLLYDFLIDGIEQGKLIVTEFDENSLPCPDCIIEADKAKEMLVYQKMLSIQNTKTDKEKARKQEKKFDVDDFSKIQFIESWEFDEESGSLRKNVKAVAFMVPQYSKSGELMGHKIPFHIWFGEPSFRD